MDQAQNDHRDAALNCHICGHFGTRRCAPAGTEGDSCDAFLSWSDLWHREMAAIKRAQRATYVVSALIGALAIVILVLPSFVG